MSNIFNDFELLEFINLDEIVWEAAGNQHVVLSAVASLSLSGHAPTCVMLGASIPKAAILITGYASQVAVLEVSIPSGSITLAAYAPSAFCVAEIPASSIDLTGYNPLFGPVSVDIPAAGITLTAYPNSIFQILGISGAASLVLAGYAPFFGPAAAIIPLASGLELTAYSPVQSWAIGINAQYKMQSIFQCILTGSADGVADLIIPISSFQSTVRDGDPSYLACVIPNSLAYITDIMARTNGDIVVKQGYKLYDGSIQAEEIIRVDYENLQITRGGRSDSATISGHKTTSSSSPKSVDLEEVSFYGLQTDGKRTFRAKPDIFLRVGDTAVYGTISIIVGQISYTVDTQQAIMQVTEA